MSTNVLDSEPGKCTKIVALKIKSTEDSYRMFSQLDSLQDKGELLVFYPIGVDSSVFCQNKGGSHTYVGFLQANVTILAHELRTFVIILVNCTSAYQ